MFKIDDHRSGLNSHAMLPKEDTLDYSAPEPEFAKTSGTNSPFRAKHFLWEVESSLATLLHLSRQPSVHSKSPGKFPAIIGTVTQAYLPVHKAAPQHHETEVTRNKGPPHSAWIGEQPPGVRCHTFHWCWVQKQKGHFCSCL